VGGSEVKGLWRWDIFGVAGQAVSKFRPRSHVTEIIDLLGTQPIVTTSERLSLFHKA
jgi:hypothetical protein